MKCICYLWCAPLWHFIPKVFLCHNWGVVLKCLLILVMIWPIFIIHALLLYHVSRFFFLQAALLQLILQSKFENLLWVFIPTLVCGCLLIRAAWIFSSLSNYISVLLKFGSKPVTGLMNSNTSRLSNVGPHSVECTCNKSTYISALVSKNLSWFVLWT